MEMYITLENIDTVPDNKQNKENEYKMDKNVDTKSEFGDGIIRVKARSSERYSIRNFEYFFAKEKFKDYSTSLNEVENVLNLVRRVETEDIISIEKYDSLISAVDNIETIVYMLTLNDLHVFYAYENAVGKSKHYMLFTDTSTGFLKSQFCIKVQINTDRIPEYRMVCEEETHVKNLRFPTAETLTVVLRLIIQRATEIYDANTEVHDNWRLKDMFERLLKTEPLSMLPDEKTYFKMLSWQYTDLSLGLYGHAVEDRIVHRIRYVGTADAICCAFCIRKVIDNIFGSKVEEVVDTKTECIVYIRNNDNSSKQSESKETKAMGSLLSILDK